MALPLTYNIRNVFVRWPVTLLSVSGIALVVTVVIALLAMVAGFRGAHQATGRADNAIVVQRGSQSELTSSIPREQARQLAIDPRVARDANGEPLASFEAFQVALMPKRDDGETTNVVVRGVSAQSFEVRANIRVQAGRRFRPGLFEVMVGENIQKRIRGLDIGARIRMERQDWEVVGIFSSGDSIHESEIWADVDAVGQTFPTYGDYQALVLRLNDPTQLAALARDYESRQQFAVKIQAEPEYYAEQAGPITGALFAFAVFVAMVMGVGAVFGAMNTMYAVVATRTREIGTLRALGFSRSSVLIGFVLEAVLLALAGGLLGCVLSLPSGALSSATGTTNFSEMVVGFRVTPLTLGAGLVFAAVMGVVGGFLPALAAARMPIVTALRDQ